MMASRMGLNRVRPKAIADASGRSGTALHQGLPFGAVMATAGASAVAGRCGLHILVVPLLVLAILQTLWLPVAGIWRRRATFRMECRAWWKLGPAHEHCGIHTVALGLAVIAGGLVALAASGIARWPWPLAVACLVLTWVLTIVCLGRFLWSLVVCDCTLRMVGGAWFLVPAALLGAAIATDALAGFAPEAGATMLAALALAGALLGWAGYWVVALAALVRVWRFGLVGVPQAPWWIAMGCAGLAAAALGRVLKAPGSGWALHAFLVQAMVVTCIFAAILCVPVLVCSAAFLLRRCRFRAPAPWPPTFSTAVFALGCLETGDILQSPAFRSLGLAAGYATLLFWLVTMVWNVGHMGIDRFGDRAWGTDA